MRIHFRLAEVCEEIAKLTQESEILRPALERPSGMTFFLWLAVSACYIFDARSVLWFGRIAYLHGYETHCDFKDQKSADFFPDFWRQSGSLNISWGEHRIENTVGPTLST
jgi:hypothetical protein